MSTPTLDDIRDAIKTLMETVPDIGTVHAYERYAREQSKFKELYLSGTGTDARILGWNIRNIATRERLIDIGRTVVDHGWRITGFMSMDDEDESEILLDNLVELLRDAFRDDDGLGGVVASVNTGTDEEIGLQKTDSGPVMFAGVLCHQVRLKLTTRHYL